MFRGSNRDHFSLRKVVTFFHCFFLFFLFISPQISFHFAHSFTFSPITLTPNLSLFQVASLTVPALDLTIDGDFAFVVTSQSVLVYDLTDKSSPSLLSSFTDVSLSLGAIRKRGDYVFACGQYLLIFQFLHGQLFLLSKTPLQFSSSSFLQSHTLELHDDLALVTSYSGFLLLNLSNLSFPTTFYAARIGHWERYIWDGSFYKSYFFISSIEYNMMSSRILVYNFSSSYYPSLFSSLEGTHFICRDDYAFTVMSNYLFRYNLTDLSSPWVDAFTTDAYYFEMDLAFYHDFLFMVKRSMSITIYDVACYPLQKIADVKVGKLYDRLYIDSNYGFFIGNLFDGSNVGVDIYQFNYQSHSIRLSYYFLIILLLILVPIISIPCLHYLKTKRHHNL